MDPYRLPGTGTPQLSVPMQPFGTPTSSGNTPGQQALIAAALRQQQQMIQVAQAQAQQSQMVAMAQQQMQRQMQLQRMMLGQQQLAVQQQPALLQLPAQQHMQVQQAAAQAALQQQQQLQQFQQAQLQHQALQQHQVAQAYAISQANQMPPFGQDPSVVAMLPHAVVDPQTMVDMAHTTTTQSVMQPHPCAQLLADGSTEEGEGSAQKSKSWTAHRTNEGKSYYYNTVTKLTTWHKPDELKTPVERIKTSVLWREYHTTDGRTYYHHTETKETTWTIPPEFADAKMRIAQLETEAMAQLAEEQEESSPTAEPSFRPVNFLTQAEETAQASATTAATTINAVLTSSKSVSPSMRPSSEHGATKRATESAPRPIIGPHLPTQRPSSAQPVDGTATHAGEEDGDQIVDAPPPSTVVEQPMGQPTVTFTPMALSMPTAQLPLITSPTMTASQLFAAQCQQQQLVQQQQEALQQQHLQQQQIQQQQQQLAAVAAASGGGVIDMQARLTVDAASELDRAMHATLAQFPSVAPNIVAAAVNQSITQSANRPTVLYPDKKSAIEAFKQMLRDCAISSDASWDGSLKAIQRDARFRALHKLNEKKQAFNAYKSAKVKEERDERRLFVKHAKDELEKWLPTSDAGVTAALQFRRANLQFEHEPKWTDVPHDARKEIFNHYVGKLIKEERESAKIMRKRNIKTLADLLDNMIDVGHETTWAEAQQHLKHCDDYQNDKHLQSMDREDALIVFQEHIRSCEEEHRREVDAAQLRDKRMARKNREAFALLLVELHNKGEVDSLSLWSKIYPFLSSDDRFTAMLYQTGSTPLDMFKFYVESLKQQFTVDRRVIKQLLTEKDLTVTAETTFDEFKTWLSMDDRTNALDASNVRMCYTAIHDKATEVSAERDRQTARKQRRVVDAFRALLRGKNVAPDSNYVDVHPDVQGDPAFKALVAEGSNPETVFKEYITELGDACGHVHNAGKKTKGKRKKEGNTTNNPRASKRSTRAHPTGGEGGKKDEEMARRTTMKSDALEGEEESSSSKGGWVSVDRQSPPIKVAADHIMIDFEEKADRATCKAKLHKIRRKLDDENSDD